MTQIRCLWRYFEGLKRWYWWYFWVPQWYHTYRRLEFTWFWQCDGERSCGLSLYHIDKVESNDLDIIQGMHSNRWIASFLVLGVRYCDRGVEDLPYTMVQTDTPALLPVYVMLNLSPRTRHIRLTSTILVGPVILGGPLIKWRGACTASTIGGMPLLPMRCRRPGGWRNTTGVITGRMPH